MISGKIQLGTTKSTFKHAKSYKGTLEIGTVAYQKADGTITNLEADGAALGVVIGSKNGYNSIVRNGEMIPLKLTASFVPVVGAQVAISDTTGIAKTYTGTGDAYVNALFVSAPMDALNEDGTQNASKFAYVDFVGGL